MPSANPKLEKQASTEATDPIRQAITVIEHKIRNLEKRKGKLEALKDLQKNGKELNLDQKTAVAKYDEVLQTLEITRELYKQIVGISNDFAKQQKKQARKEALERMQQDISKIREVLLIQDVLINIGGDVVREDFLTGGNGAIKLTQDDLKFLDDFYNEVTMKRQIEPNEPSFMQQLQKAAEHYMGILEGKPREVAGTTYLRLKEIITSVQACGYFDQVQTVETEVIINEVALEAPVEVATGDGKNIVEQPSEEFTNNSGDVTIIPPPESMIPMPNFPVQVTPVAVVAGGAPVAGPMAVVTPQAIPAPHPPAPVETAYYANAAGYVPQPQQPQQPQPQQQQQQTPRINDVIGTPNFFFLQESELDQPEGAAGQPPTIVQHIPPPPVNAPIPTQTFTNQNFTGAPVQVPQQVIYQHPPQEMSHIPGFANPNPPPPIPMPPSHQQNIPYSPQHPAGQFQAPAPGQQAIQPTQNFDQQETQQSEEKPEQHAEETEVAPVEADPASEPVNWCQMADAPMDEWSNDNAQQSEHSDHQQSQQGWGEQRSSYRGRGGRRGNSNGYNSRGRGTGNYQQNGRGGSGQGSYYRNDNSNYQNGYQQRNYNNDGGSSNYNGGGFKRERGGASGGSGGPRTNSRGGDRVGIDRGGRGGQFRGGQRGGNRGGGYAPRGKPQTQQ